MLREGREKFTNGWKSALKDSKKNPEVDTNALVIPSICSGEKVSVRACVLHLQILSFFSGGEFANP